ncbi:hypothetical protein BV20DRAFT_360535 [Pilatotrama ljubarskyi]|nr:hypothetical protein BV20DRAFT_360535 [Pilatotrama ljubarskyi]
MSSSAVSSLGFGALSVTHTGFPVASSANFASATASISVASSTPGLSSAQASPSLNAYLYLYDTLHVAVGALLVGLLFASIFFGVVCTKALSYVRSARWGKDATMGFTAHAVCWPIIRLNGHYTRLLDSVWSIMMQIMFMTYIASVTQSFFVYRLHTVKRNWTFTSIALFFINLQLIMSIVALVQMAQKSFIDVMLYNATLVWPMTTTYGIASGIDVVVAALGYKWLQKSNVLVQETEYWMFKSLFTCGILSLFSAIAVSIMGTNFTWLAVTFVLGNLYTLSVLLNLKEVRHPFAEIAPTVPAYPAPRPASHLSSTVRASTATLAVDEGLWEDIVKAQKLAPVEPPAMLATKV